MTQQPPQMSNEQTLLQILKLRLGILTDKRDDLLKHLINSIVTELREQQGINLDLGRTDHQFFIVDYAEYRYSNTEYKTMPQHIRWRMNNLMLSSRKEVRI